MSTEFCSPSKRQSRSHTNYFCFQPHTHIVHTYYYSDIKFLKETRHATDSRNKLANKYSHAVWRVLKLAGVHVRTDMPYSHR